MATSPFERLRDAILAELFRHQDFLSAPGLGLRSVQITVKLKPNGEPRVVLFYPEIEREMECPRR